jgi:vacuolar-type H+-ATPase subunit I/STV1
MNAYEMKQAARRARFEELAAKAESESTQTYGRARKMSESIPFGQPVLVGHHSERRDRNFRDRIHDTFGKAFALRDKAEYYERKAENVGQGGISSDDPDAPDKLRAELTKLEELQERMKAANRIIRQREGDEDDQVNGLLALGWLTNAQARELVAPDFAGRVGFPGFALTNNSANIRRIKNRIATLEKLRQRTDAECEGRGYTYREDMDENRVMFIFPDKPAEAVRKLLSAHAFHWSPTRNAWVRKMSNAALWAAKSIREALDKPE